MFSSKKICQDFSNRVGPYNILIIFNFFFLRHSNAIVKLPVTLCSSVRAVSSPQPAIHLKTETLHCGTHCCRTKSHYSQVIIQYNYFQTSHSKLNNLALNVSLTIFFFFYFVYFVVSVRVSRARVDMYRIRSTTSSNSHRRTKR